VELGNTQETARCRASAARCLRIFLRSRS